jgi:hypothetical protein
MCPQDLQVLHPSAISHFHLSYSSTSFCHWDYLHHSGDSWMIYPIKGGNTWHYFTGLHQDIFLHRCTHLFSATLTTVLSSCYTNATDCNYIHCVCVYFLTLWSVWQLYSNWNVKHLQESLSLQKSLLASSNIKKWTCDCSTRIIGILPVTVCNIFLIMFSSAHQWLFQ